MAKLMLHQENFVGDCKPISPDDFNIVKWYLKYYFIIFWFTYLSYKWTKTYPILKNQLNV